MPSDFLKQGAFPVYWVLIAFARRELDTDQTVWHRT